MQNIQIVPEHVVIFNHKDVSVELKVLRGSKQVNIFSNDSNSIVDFEYFGERHSIIVKPRNYGYAQISAVDKLV